MGMGFWRLLGSAMVVALLATAPARAQSCSDGNECTNPDMCSDGTCNGTPVAGSCDDGNPCTVNDTCVSGVCQGTVEVGRACGDEGCEGTCTANGQCLPDFEKQGQPCTDSFGDCTTDDQCLGTLCLGAFKTCPDADDNKCTLDICNIQTGQCVTLGVPPCGPCQGCDAQTGCFDANDGLACDDFNACTGDGTCQAGSCLAGAPVGSPTETPLTPAATTTATPTGTAAPPTDTPTAGATDTATAVATITDTPPPGPTDTATAGATATDTLTPTGIPTGTASATETPTGIPTGTATATETLTPTGIPTGTATATATATGVPTGTATATVTATPTGIPTGTTTATVTATRTNTPTVVIPATSTATATRTPLPVMASIIVGDTVGLPDTAVFFDVTLETDASIAGVQVDIAYPAAAPIIAKDGKPDCTVNPAIDKNATSFAFQPPDCTPGTDCTAVRAIVLSLDNLDPIAGGARLFSCNLAIAADADGTYPLACSNPGAGDTGGDKVGADCTGGTLTVEQAAEATIVVSDVTGAAGQTAPMTVSLQTGVEVAGTQNDTGFEDGITVAAKANGKPDCAVNPAIDKGGTSFAFLPSGCTPGTDCVGVRALVLALDNVAPIPDGSVLYTCQVAIAETVEDGRYPITCANDGASDSDGNAVSTTCSTGDVIVGVQPTPTDTPSASPSVTPTNTPTATPEVRPTDTVTPTPSASATATRTRKPKTGNDDDGCQVAAPAGGGAAWLLLLPVAALLWRRRR